jgi:hypothetical protein
MPDGVIINDMSDEPLPCEDIAALAAALAADATGAESQGVPDDLPYCEVKDSPNETFVMDGSSAKRTFFVPWCHRQRFVRMMLGFPYMDGGAMKRKLPGYHPEYLNVAGDPFLFATRAEVKGLAFRAQNPEYDEPVSLYALAEITVTYETLPFDVKFLAGLADPKEFRRYVRFASKYAFEYLSSEWGGWQWYNTGNAAYEKQAIGSRIGIPQGVSHFTYTWFDVHPDAFARARAEDKIGMINSDVFDGKPAETLLLIAVNAVPRQAPSGIRTLEVTFETLYKRQGHNKFLHPVGEYFEVRAKPDPNNPGAPVRRPLQTTTFADLWTP